MTIRSRVSVLLLALAVGTPAFAQSADGPLVQLVPHFETGAVKVLFHEYLSGSTASGDKVFDYVKQGGQEILFPYQRLSVDFAIGNNNLVTLLYQPLNLTTKTVAGKNTTAAVQVDGTAFATGTPLDLVYGFDFWRSSWLYDFAPDKRTILGAGLSLQLRNASISFNSADGTQRAISQNLGLVPILKARAAHWFTPEFALDAVADGFYASSAFFNGAGKPFKGWIWDASLSAKTRFIPGSTAFVTVRTIGGGAEGSSAYATEYATQSTNPGSFNALATAALTLGVELE